VWGKNSIDVKYPRYIAPSIEIKKPNWRSFHMEIVKKKEYTTVSNNELLLGTEFPDGDELITIPFNPNRRITIIISGDNDSGKTTLLNSIVYDQLHYRYGRYIAHIDPKGDTLNIEHPNINPEFIRKLADHEIYAGGYYLKRIYAKASGMLGIDGQSFIPALPDFQGADKATEMNRLKEFFHLTTPDASAALGLLCAAMQNKPETIKELLNGIAQMKESGVGERTKKLESEIMARKLTDELGDESINMPKLLHDFHILVLRVPLTKETMTDFIASLFVSNIMGSREKAIMTGDGWVNKPTSIVCDEADKYAGERTLTNSLINQVTTKFRALNNTVGLDSILASQHISYLDPTQVLEADYIIGTRLNLKADIELLRPRAGMGIYTMQETEFVIGQHPKEWWILDKNGQVFTFYPLPTRCSMKKVSS